MSSVVDRVQPPRLPRMADLVAAKLRSRIVGGELENGDELPREADLVEEFGVSRPSLREAIRILETEGLVRMRRGKVGGAVVKRPDAESAAYHLGLSLQARATSLADLAVARSVLEPACVGLMAGLPDDRRAGAVVVLTELVDRSENLIGDFDAFTKLSLGFHSAIADQCGNATMSTLAGALDSVWSSQSWSATPLEAPLEEVQREVLREHRKLVRAIQSGNVANAKRIASAHVDGSALYSTDLAGSVEALSLRG